MDFRKRQISKKEIDSFVDGYTWEDNNMKCEEGITFYDKPNFFKELKEKDISYISGVFSRIFYNEKIDLKKELFDLLIVRLGNSSDIENYNDFFDGFNGKVLEDSESNKKGLYFKEVFDNFFEMLNKAGIC